MAKTYEQMMRQIEGLQNEAEKLRRKEISGVIDRIREAIKFYGITASDLGLARSESPRAAAGPGRKRRKAADKQPQVVKYRNDSGGTWAGRGKRPQWLRDALAAGKTLDDFKV